MIKNIVDTMIQKLPVRDGKKADAIFLEKELSGIASRVLEVQYPEFMGRSLVPLDNDGVSRGQQFLRRKVMNSAGTAEIINDKTSVVPNVSLSTDEIVKQVKELGVSWSWTISEIEAAAFANVSLSSSYSMAAMRHMEAAADQILATGSTISQPNASETGLLNNASISATAQDWSAATGADLLNFLTAMRYATGDASDNVFVSDTIVLSPRLLNQVSSTSFSAQTPESVLTVFKMNNPGVEVIGWAKATNFVSTGVDRAVAYKRSPDVLSYASPVPFEMLPVQADAYKFVVPCRSTLFSTQILQSQGVSYFDVTA